MEMRMEVMMENSALLYSGSNVVNAKINGQMYLIPLDRLWIFADEDEYPEHIELDYGDGMTPLMKIQKIDIKDSPEVFRHYCDWNLKQHVDWTNAYRIDATGNPFVMRDGMIRAFHPTTISRSWSVFRDERFARRDERDEVFFGALVGLIVGCGRIEDDHIDVIIPPECSVPDDGMEFVLEKGVSMKKLREFLDYQHIETTGIPECPDDIGFSVRDAVFCNTLVAEMYIDTGDHTASLPENLLMYNDEFASSAIQTARCSWRAINPNSVLHNQIVWLCMPSGNDERTFSENDVQSEGIDKGEIVKSLYLIHTLNGRFLCNGIDAKASNYKEDEMTNGSN